MLMKSSKEPQKMRRGRGYNFGGLRFKRPAKWKCPQNIGMLIKNDVIETARKMFQEWESKMISEPTGKKS